MSAHYHLRFRGRPLCQHMDHQAGRMFCERAGVSSCSYRTHRAARAAMGKLNGQDGYAGSTKIAPGECPLMA